jgi:hypothetical protein
LGQLYAKSVVDVSDIPEGIGKAQGGYYGRDCLAASGSSQ